METPGPPLLTTDGVFYSTTVELKTNASNPSKNNTDDFELFIPGTVYISIISSLEIPIICLAIYAVYSLIKAKQAAPVFVINLLTADLIQIVFILLLTTFQTLEIMMGISVLIIAWAGLVGSYFMTCIAIERYVLIAQPVWHRTHRSVKCYMCTSLTGWLVSFTIFPIIFMYNILTFFTPFIFYPVVIVCFVGSFRSLSHSVSITPIKKQLVLAPLFFVVMTYTFLILPVNILFIVHYRFTDSLDSLLDFTGYLYLLNPLVDCLLYVFMRSDAENIIRTPLCCSRLKRVQTEMGQTTFTDVQSDHV